ncbi:unnamed protein product [Rhodiola kirilowii]
MKSRIACRGGSRGCPEDFLLVRCFKGGWARGLPVHRGDVFHAINRLRKLKLNKRALEVMEWVIRERPYRPKELDYSYLLEFTTKLHGMEQGEKLFSRVPSEFQNELLFNNLVIACLDKAARLYTVAETYVEAVEKSMTGDNWSTLDVLLILYGYLGRAKGVEQTWSAVCKLQNVRAKSYMLMIEAMGRIGDISRAEEIWAEMKTSKGLKLTDQFNSMISVYCKHGMIAKASKLYKEMKASGLKPNSITFRNLALGCLKADLIDEAFKTLELEITVGTSRRVKMSTPWLETTLQMVDVFAEKGDVRNVEKLFEDLKRGSFTRYTFVYNTLMKAYVKAKIYEPNLLRRMILGGARPDSESYSLMKLVEQFRN